PQDERATRAVSVRQGSTRRAEETLVRGTTPPPTPPPRNTTPHDTTEQPRRGTAEETLVWGAAPHLETAAPRHHRTGHRRAS
ncbi:hypothetical protein, partial [Streptomyces yangpuensis]|uniref:hypothetical protein n=1 Tax=Streptomyces yangpuensis TaxID=1648182 RepID=UPI0035D8FB55